MLKQNGAIHVWLMILVVLLGIATVFFIWWFIIRGESTTENIPTVTMQVEEEPVDDTPRGYEWYTNEDLNLTFLYPEEWKLFPREFGNAQNIEQADLPLTASDFDLSYFATSQGRIILDLPNEVFCQQTRDIKVWQAYQGDKNPSRTTDKRCTEPERLLINDYFIPAFADESETTHRYGLFLPFKDGGGLGFNDTAPIPENATIPENGAILDKLKSSLREKVRQFIVQNQQFLNNPEG